jgi:integrase
MASYITRRGTTYYYRRRVPEYLSSFEQKKFIKVSLGTKDEKEALRKAAIYNDYIENYWRGLIRDDGSADPDIEYQKAIQLAKSHGFAYLNITDIAREPLEDIVKRLEAVTKKNKDPEIVASLLGGSEAPDIYLSACFEQYIHLCRDRTINKSEHQIRKWKTPRMASINHFITCLGDKLLKDVSRSNILEFRRWWLDRIESSDVTASTANKNMMQVKDILQVVSTNNEIDLDFDVLFAKVRFKVVEKSRPPFDVDYVQNVLLSSEVLKNLNDEARLLVFAMADTGARESELIGLTEDDIVLNEPIPYIWIRPRDNKALKTLTSERKIPLVGASLYAFQQLPNGFNHYRTADTASTTINKFLRENDLKPTPDHSLYSLRHTFKDRLRDAGAPEEIIDELMGHKKSGPKYGRGHMLDKKHDWLKKIAFTILN